MTITGDSKTSEKLRAVSSNEIKIYLNTELTDINDPINNANRSGKRLGSVVKVNVSGVISYALSLGDQNDDDWLDAGGATYTPIGTPTVITPGDITGDIDFSQESSDPSFINLPVYTTAQLEDISDPVNDKVASGKKLSAMVIGVLAGNPRLYMAIGQEPEDGWIEPLGASLQPV